MLCQNNLVIYLADVRPWMGRQTMTPPPALSWWQLRPCSLGSDSVEPEVNSQPDPFGPTEWTGSACLRLIKASDEHGLLLLSLYVCQ